MRFENVCMHQESTDICLKKKKHIFHLAIASTEINIRNGVLDTSSVSFFFYMLSSANCCHAKYCRRHTFHFI